MNSDIIKRLDSLSVTLLDNIRRDLEANDRNASNSLSKSLRVTKTYNSSNLNLTFTANDYWYFVENGRKKGKRPPLEDILKWVRIKLQVPTEEENSVAYLVARKIGLNGTKGTDVFSTNIKKAVITREEITEIIKRNIKL